MIADNDLPKWAEKVFIHNEKERNGIPCGNHLASHLLSYLNVNNKQDKIEEWAYLYLLDFVKEYPVLIP